MNDSLAQRSRLDAQRQPVALIHSGMFVFANQAFLQLIGVDSFDDLLGVPLLDLAEHDEHLRIKQLLQQADQDIAGDLKDRPQLLNMQTLNRQSLPVNANFEKVLFEDENCVQLTLQRASDSRLVNRLRSVSWAYYLSIAVLVVLSLMPNVLLLKLDINNAPKVLFPEDEPAVIIDNEVREYFPTDEVIVFLFEGVALYSDGFLTAYHALAEGIQDHPNVQKVMSVTTQEHISGSADGFYVNPLIDTELLDESHPSERPAMIQADRFARGALIAKQDQALSMVVIPEDADTSIARLKLMQDIDALIDEQRLRGYVTAVAGQVPVDIAQLDSMLRDNMIFIPATTGIGLLLIWFLFRRLLAVIVSGVIIGVIVSSTIALYVMFNQPFTLIASITPPLLSALTIAALVHLFNALNYASQRGLIGRTRVEKALSEIRRPAMFTALTTAAGLASLGLSPIPAIATFGLIASAGVVLIFVVVIYFIPQIFIRWDHSPWPKARGGLHWMDAIVRRLATIGLRYPGYVLAATILLLAIGLPQVMRIEVETNLQEFFNHDHPIRQSTDRVDELLIGSMPAEVFLRSDDLDTMKLPETLFQIKHFQEWAELQPEIDKTTSLVDFIEEMHWGFNEEQDEFRAIPENPDLISQYLLVYDGEDLFDLVDQDYQVSRITLNMNVHSANDIGAVMERLDKKLEDSFPGMQSDIAGVGRLFSDMEELLVEGQVYSLGGALVLIFVLMLVLWRSLSQALICMLPNLSPIILIFICMGLFGIWLDTATAMIASVAVGIAVDDTIHVFHGFIKRVKNGVAPAAAILRTTSHAGRAVMTTTIILASQFLILMGSEFIPTSNFGLLTSIGLVTALLFDVLVLPAILVLIYRRRKPAAPAPAPAAA